MMRRVELGDCARLAEIHRHSFEVGWNETTFAEMVNRSNNHVYGVDEDGNIQAFVVLSVVAGEAEILTLATDPACRGRGLARRLLGEALASLRAEAVFLEVAQDNAAAIGLYEGLGFEQVGVRRGYYARRSGPAVDALILRLALCGA